MNESLVLSWIYPESVNGMFMQSVVSALRADSEREHPRILGPGAFISLSSGPRIAEARNQVVRQFLDNTTAEWLLMIDSDMVFTEDAIDKLFEAAHPSRCPIVGGLCFAGGRSAKIAPTIYVLNEDRKEGDDAFVVMEDYPEDALVEVIATGAAFLLMHRSALKRIGDHFGMPYPWFAEGTVTKGGTPFGEDWAFCLRARDRGIPVYVHTGAKTGHVKSHIIDEDTWKQHRQRRDEVGLDALDAEIKKKVVKTVATTGVPSRAIIPQKGNTAMTSALLKQLKEEGVPALVMDNGSDPDEFLEMELHGADTLYCPDMGIYEMWNVGVDYWKERTPGPLNVAVLNNDLRLGPDCITRLAGALRANDDLVALSPNYDKRPGMGVQIRQGTFGAKGMAGFCFLIKAEEASRFSEDYEWWFGDDDFVAQAWTSGKRTGVLLDASVIHLDGGSQTAGDLYDPSNPRHETLERDKKRFLDRWEGAKIA